jgi:hypothetical protein
VIAPFRKASKTPCASLTRPSRVVLLGISVWIRLRLDESPEFKRMKAEGRASKAPLSETFKSWKNVKLILVGALCILPAQAVIW